MLISLIISPSLDLQEFDESPARVRVTLSWLLPSLLLYTLCPSLTDPWEGLYYY